MTSRSTKKFYFLLEGMNSFATTIYFYYVFFFMAKAHGFSNVANLGLSASNGFVYMLSAWFGGRVGQRLGYYTALKIGWTVMIGSYVAGTLIESWQGHVAVLITATLGMCFTWPNLEALVSEKETPQSLARMIGIYNVTWAAVSATAFFTGGALLEKLGLRSIFYIPICIHATQFLLVQWLQRQPQTQAADPPSRLSDHSIPALNPRPIAKAKTFLKMAWLCNPFAYVAVNTIAAVMPGIARELQLTPMFTGFFCSIWFFSRLATFISLWLWDGWHYRFRWFVTAYSFLILGFATILLNSRLWVVILAQLIFGMALGLIYYSSLFYSMDVGEAKGEHGGLHEAAIGSGIFVGPGVAASTLFLFPDSPHSGAIAVTILLILGFAGLLTIQWRNHKHFLAK